MPGARSRGRDHEPRDARSRRRPATAALLAALTACAIGADSGQAGTYVMRNCDVPGQGPLPMFPWKTGDDRYLNTSIEDRCATGHGVSFVFTSPREIYPTNHVHIELSKPRGERSPIELVKVMLWYAARLEGSGSPLLFRTVDLRSDGTRHEGISNLPPGAENLVAEQQLSPLTTFFRAGVDCGVFGTADPCSAAQDVPLLIRGMEVTLREDVPPVVARPTGSLLDSGPQSGVRALVYAASDTQSGLSKVEVLLGDTVVASRDLTPRCTPSDFTVCPVSADETIQVDTRAVANGSHQLTIRVLDAAGNVGLIRAGHAIEVANSSVRALPSAAVFTVAAEFKGTTRRTLTVSYGRRVAVRGRLSEGAHPVEAGTPVEVLERLDRRGARERSIARVLTKPDGSFDVRLAKSRPSRTLRLAYRPVGGGQVVSRVLKLRVRAASRVRATLRGRVVRFNGRVLSGPMPKGGKRVQMEGRSPGSAWTPFKALRTDKKGRFSGTYRLRVRRPGVVLKIRAVVPSEGGYGYIRSRSRAVSLRVR